MLSMYSAPSFADLDGDGDLDAFIGELLRRHSILPEHRQCHQPGFHPAHWQLNPFNGVDVGLSARPASPTWMEMATWMLSSVKCYGIIHYFENTGSATNPAFIEAAAASILSNGVDCGLLQHPQLCRPGWRWRPGCLHRRNGWQHQLFPEHRQRHQPGVCRAQSGSLNPFNGVDVGYVASSALPTWMATATWMPSLGIGLGTSTTTRTPAAPPARLSSAHRQPQPLQQWTWDMKPPRLCRPG